MRIFLLFLFVFTTALLSEENFYDENGEFDISNYLSQAYGFFPMPMLLTEPALGYGAGISLIYLHDKFSGKTAQNGRKIPVSISGVVGGATQNKTVFGGAFHLGYWLEDTIRTITFAGYPSVNIDLFTQNDRAVSMNFAGPLFYQAFKFRTLQSNLFLGLSYLYTSTKASSNKDTPLGSLLEATYTNSAVGVSLSYDKRDNTLSPNKGYFVTLNNNFFRKTLGSQSDFEKFYSRAYLYTPLVQNFYLESKFAYESVLGEQIPSYMYPFIDQRGIAVMRYQGQKVLSTEQQLRWNFSPRWNALVFAGVGRAYAQDAIFGNYTPFKEAKNRWSGGVGFRYLIASKFGLRVGIDVATSRDNNAFYIQFGSAWHGL